MEVVWTAFPLHPETPEEGRSLASLFAHRSKEYKQMGVYLRQVAAQEGLPMGERTMTYNSRLAQELGKWAESQGKGDSFHNEVFRAYFVQGKNIAKVSELKEIAGAAGLSREAAQDVLEQRTFQEAVDRDWAHSRQMGITAVPTFMMDRKALVGAQPYDVLEEFVRTNLSAA